MKDTIVLTESDRRLLAAQHIAWEIEEFEQWQREERELQPRWGMWAALLVFDLCCWAGIMALMFRWIH